MALLDTAQIVALTSAQIAAIDSKDMTALSSTQIAAFTTDQAAGFTAPELNAMLSQVQYLQSGVISNLGTSAIASLTTKAMGYISASQINALTSSSQIQNPQFGAYAGTNVAPPPIANATAQQGQFAQNNYNAQVASQNANTAGLYTLGGAGIIAMSDRRLKSNIVRIGTHPIGVGIYEYDIFGNRQIGVMAQELLEVMPEAVLQHPSGYLMVNYGRL
jgi:hypothetical protein